MLLSLFSCTFQPAFRGAGRVLLGQLGSEQKAGPSIGKGKANRQPVV